MKVPWKDFQSPLEIVPSVHYYERKQKISNYEQYIWLCTSLWNARYSVKQIWKRFSGTYTCWTDGIRSKTIMPLCKLKKKCQCYDKVIFFEKNFVSFRFDLLRIVNFPIFPIVLLHNKSVIFARVILSFYFLLLFQQYKGHCFKVTKTNYIRVINQMTQLF